MFSKIFNLSNLVLVVALTLSVIAAWYSILGLVAIFAAAIIPIIIMGGALEVAKVVTTIWLHRYWDKISILYKIYLVPAVITLALITSMGIFGFLSKAHMDQTLVSGDVQAKIALYDEKIKIAKENIDANRRSLKQMDEAVDQTMGRSTTEQGADKAVQVRRSQARERTRLLADIEAEQKKITEFNEARAPIAAEIRKVEAEVGPIKYIAALIYGDDPDANLLERAVRWVIILLVFVFDPLALILVIASNTSRHWQNIQDTPTTQPKEETLTEPNIETNKEDNTTPLYVADVTMPEPLATEEKVDTPIDNGFSYKDHTYLFRPFSNKTSNKLGPIVYKPEPIQVVKEVKEPEIINCSACDTELVNVPTFGLFCPNSNCSLNTTSLVEPIDEIVEEVITEPTTEETNVPTTDPKIETEGVTKAKPFKIVEGDYVVYDGKSMKKEAFQSLHPEFLKLTADSMMQPSTNFGTAFPKMSGKGDIFIRVDVLPNRVFKFDGTRWIEINKASTDTYMYDKAYIEYLVNKISSGEYDIDLLSDIEKQMLENYLSNQKS